MRRIERGGARLIAFASVFAAITLVGACLTKDNPAAAGYCCSGGVCRPVDVDGGQQRTDAGFCEYTDAGTAATDAAPDAGCSVDGAVCPADAATKD